jgi:glycosyltransferase involved in cell wall biosynthesis
MRIAWFTPYSRKSAIARFSAAVVRELARRETVDLWYPPAKELLASEVRSVCFQSAAEVEPQKLAAYDLLVYNLGNYLSFHGEIYEVSRRCPGVCVMHDFVMHHFFAAYYLEQLKQPEAYVASMRRWAGARGSSVAEQILSGRRMPVWETEEVARYPLFEEAIRGAYGVVTHAEFFRRRVEAVFSVPCVRLNIAYELMPVKSTISREDLGVSNAKLLLLTIGHVNPNKRVPSVLRALAANRDLLGRIVYVVAGPCEPGRLAELEAIISRLGLEGTVRLAGYVDEERLQAYLRHADLCINLRFPAIEGASASLVEEMLHGKAVIVTDTGFYSELPVDTVMKIRPEHEQEELTSALRRLVTNAGLREAIGSRAREFAEKHFRADQYAEEFLKFGWEVRTAKPMLELADRVAGELRGMGVATGMEIVDTVSRECEQLFCAGPEPGTGNG